MPVCMCSRAPRGLYWCVCMHECAGRLSVCVSERAFIFDSYAIFILADPRLNQHGENRFIIIFIKVYRFSHEQHNKTAANCAQIYAFGEFATKIEFTSHLMPVFSFFFLLFCAVRPLLALALRSLLFPSICINNFSTLCAVLLMTFSLHQRNGKTYVLLSAHC